MIGKLDLKKILLIPDLEWEGAKKNIKDSEKGSPGRLVNQFRDPFFLKTMIEKNIFCTLVVVKME